MPDENNLSPKFIKKYMRLAKIVAEDQNPCLSRSVGAVIVDPVENRVLSTGYNGPPRGTPHPDDPTYLSEVVWPQLTAKDKRFALVNAGHMTKYVFFDSYDSSKKKAFLSAYANSGICPRRAIGAQSGERLEICSCEHAEKCSIIQAGRSVWGTWMFCWCGVPCWDCTKLIINAGIKKVFCLETEEDYSPHSRWLFKKAGVELDIRKEEFFLND
jgi:dCMP deaminase